MKFSYETFGLYDEVLSVNTDEGFRIDIWFSRGEIDYLNFDDYQMWSLDGFFVSIDGKYVSLRKVQDEAERQYPAIIAEVEQEQADEEAHEREMSSPEATGRI